jgi:hypothetical protein
MAIFRWSLPPCITITILDSGHCAINDQTVYIIKPQVVYACECECECGFCQLAPCNGCLQVGLVKSSCIYEAESQAPSIFFSLCATCGGVYFPIIKGKSILLLHHATAHWKYPSSRRVGFVKCAGYFQGN